MKINQSKLLLIAMLLFGLIFQDAFADPSITQILPTINQTNPGVAANRLATQPVIPWQNNMGTPTTADNLQTPIPGGDKLTFVLNKVDFSGNHVFCNAQLMAIVQPYLHQQISVTQLQGIVDKVTCLYRNAGYILSRAVLPQQSIADGTVHIQILEAYVNQVTITGCPGKARCLLEAYGRRIVASGPLQMKVLERYILLANDIPGEEVHVVITPSPTTPDAAALTFVTQHKSIDICAGYDNFGTKYLGPEEFSSTIGLNSWITPGDRTAITGMLSQDPRELHFIEIIHSLPLNSNGLSLMLGGNYTETKPGDILSPITVDGTAYTVYGTLTQSIIRSRCKNLNVFLTGNYQDIDSDILNTPLYNDRLRSLQIGTYFDLTDPWHGFNTALLSAEQGFSIWGAQNDNTFSRPNGHSDYTKLNLEISRTQFLNSYFSLYAAGKAQYGFQPLLAAEQFYFGGPCYGRGYDSAIILGDRGIAGTIELRLDTEPNFLTIHNAQYYLFYDAGSIWNYPTLGLASRATATSCGAGIRFGLNKILSGNVYVGQPLVKPPADAIGVGVNVNQARVFFQIRASI